MVMFTGLMTNKYRKSYNVKEEELAVADTQSGVTEGERGGAGLVPAHRQQS